MTSVECHRAGRTTGRLHPDLADDALVLVALVPLDAHILPENHAGQVQLRSLTEGLRLFRRVDALKANLVLLAVAIKDGYRVAISDADYTASQGVGVGEADQ